MLALNNARYPAIGRRSAGAVLYSPIRDLRAAADSRGAPVVLEARGVRFHVTNRPRPTAVVLALHGWHSITGPTTIRWLIHRRLRIIAPDCRLRVVRAAAHNWAKEEVPACGGPA